MLAAAALVARPRAKRIGVACVGGATLAVATGLPPFYDLVVRLPGLSAAHNGRFAVVTVLCLAVLAGWGLDDLSGPRLRRRRAILAVGLGLLAAPAVIVAAAGRLDADALGPALRVAWGFATPTRGLASPVGGGVSEVIKLASLLEWLVVAAAALGLVLLRLRRRLGASAFVAVAALLVAADLFRAGMGYNPAIPLSHARQPLTPAIRFLRAKQPVRFAGLKARAPVSLTLPLPPNVAMRYGLYDSRGYVIPHEERYGELWRRVIAANPACYYAFCAVAADTTPRALRALGIVGVGYLLQNRRDPPLRRLRPVYAGPDARIYANPDALPRAFLVDRQIVVRDGASSLARVTSPGFRARAAAVTERRLPWLAVGASPRSGSVGLARIADYGRERVVVDVHARAPALLVLTDTWFPGWKATVDGAGTAIHRVDYVIRGVQIAPGHHHVQFRYEPASWRAGWIVSAVGFGVVVALGLYGWRRRRPGRTTAADAAVG